MIGVAGRAGPPGPPAAGRAGPLGPPTTGRAGPLGPPDSEPAYPRRKILAHTIPGWARKNPIFFVTVCCRPRGANHLCRDDVASILFEAVDFRQKSGWWFARLFLLMPDHLHALISFPECEDFRRVAANFKEVTAKQAGVSWQRDFFDHRIRARESLRQKWDYIRLNPVRRGLAENPERWPYVWTVDEWSGGPSGPALPPDSADVARAVTGTSSSAASAR